MTVDLYNLGSPSTRKGAATLCAYGCTAETPITSICLHAGWLIGNLKIHFLRYEVAGDQFNGCIVSDLNPVTSEFDFYCCYFETTVLLTSTKYFFFKFLKKIQKLAMM